MNPVMNPVVATNIAVGLYVVEQTALWGATFWNVGMSYFEAGARLAFPDYPQFRPGSR